MVEKEKIIDCLHKFGNEFQIKCVSSLLSDKSFFERIIDILDPKYFEADANQWIVTELIKYFQEYRDLPTLVVFKVKIDAIEDEILKRSVIDHLKMVYQKVSDSDITYVKETFLEFCKNQKMKMAVYQSVDLLRSGEYERIKHTFDEALKAGMERNLGHDYFVDVDKRLSDIARFTIKTNWPLVDSLLDGGLAKGELGIIISSAGGGKCVGPNTEIEIQYYEIGISIIGNSGKEYIMWINPFEKYEIGEMSLFGWQIEELLNKVDLLKQQPVKENLKK